MKIPVSCNKYNLEKLPVSSYWSNEGEKEIKMHKIHAYAAKFPSFVVSKSIEYASKKGLKPEIIGDIFCGCGTTALEAKRNNINFWGCDINPVATLIARVKSEQYDQSALLEYYNIIITSYETSSIVTEDSVLNNERLNYWFDVATINNLYKLLTIVKTNIPERKYRDFFFCAFSNILKSTSRWLTKSIKPQIDPNKTPQDVKAAFEKQVLFMFKATKQASLLFKSNSETTITTQNFLTIPVKEPILDVLVTSPPYVTSYEYADLHQLSSLWLGYTTDYRSLRNGTIGSLYHNHEVEENFHLLNDYAQATYTELAKFDKSKAKSVAKYFLDMNRIVQKSYNLLKENALSFIVIGNTQYKSIKINNAKYIIDCMKQAGFEDIQVQKRKIGSKNLTPYRDAKGKFTKATSDLNIYSHEYVIIGKK